MNIKKKNKVPIKSLDFIWNTVRKCFRNLIRGETWSNLFGQIFFIHHFSKKFFFSINFEVCVIKIKFTHFKCIGCWLLTIVHICVITTPIKIQTFLSPKVHLCPSTVNLSPPVPQITNHLFSIIVDDSLLSIENFIWMKSLQCLSTFTQQNVCESHPCYCISNLLLFVLEWYSLYKYAIIYLSIHPQTRQLGCFQFGYYEEICLEHSHSFYGSMFSFLLSE